MLQAGMCFQMYAIVEKLAIVYYCNNFIFMSPYILVKDNMRTLIQLVCVVKSDIMSLVFLLDTRSHTSTLSEYVEKMISRRVGYTTRHLIWKMWQRSIFKLPSFTQLFYTPLYDRTSVANRIRMPSNKPTGFCIIDTQ